MIRALLAIETRNLTKRFKTAAAVDGLNLQVPSGSAYGFLGPNGAGKTTTIRILMGLAAPTTGEARILGEPAGPRSPALRRVGFLPDVPAFYGWMRAPEYLEFAGNLFGLDRRLLKRRTAELLEFTGLAGVRTRIGGFSRGMKQRLGLAQALINKPDLVILDEPTSALDPVGRHEVLETVRTLVESQSTTVFFSTHILADVERVCDRVGILHRGRLVTDELLKDLKARYTRYAQPIFDVTVEAQAEQLAGDLAGQDWVEKVEKRETSGGAGGAGTQTAAATPAVLGPAQSLRVRARDGEAARRGIPRLIAQRGLALIRFETSEPTLEDIFLKLVGEP